MKTLLTFILFVLLCISCTYEKPNSSSREIGSLLWVNSSMSDTAIKIAVQKNLENSTLIIAQISWSPIDSTFFQNVKWYAQLAKESGKKLMLNIDWQNENRSSSSGNWSFEDIEVKKKFMNDVRNLVAEYSPNFLTLGVEVNYYALKNPKGYASFVQTFNEIKKQINQIKPNTQIGISFQLELLFGIHKDWQPNISLGPLEAINSNLDYIGISTYPDVCILENSLSYIDTLKKKFPQPLGITETGMSSNHNNESSRIKYITYLSDKIKSTDLKFVIWGSIIDHVSSPEWQHNLGLIEIQGHPKSEFETWKQLIYR